VFCCLRDFFGREGPKDSVGSIFVFLIAMAIDI
jgi:hypothetical protein